MSPLGSWKGMQQTKAAKPFGKGAFFSLKLGLSITSWMIVYTMFGGTSRNATVLARVIYIQTEQTETPQCSDKHFNN